MLRWFKKRRQQSEVKEQPLGRKDEYGFDVDASQTLSRRGVEHIYEEIPELPGLTAGFLSRVTKVNLPELPPRNRGRPAKPCASYSKWRAQSLSRKTMSLPDLADAEDTGDEDGSIVHGLDDIMRQGTGIKCGSERLEHNGNAIATKYRSLKGTPKSPKCSTLFVDDFIMDFDETLVSGFDDRQYFPLESDSGYDYSGSSSNGSDVNDSGISGSYEFHLSKAEQLRRLEQEIHNLSLQTCRSRTQEKLIRRRNMLLKCRERNLSLISLSSNTSVTSDLDFDDEMTAYGEKANRSSTEDCHRITNMTPHRQTIPRNTSVSNGIDSLVHKVRLSMPSTTKPKTSNRTRPAHVSNTNCSRLSAEPREGTPHYQRPVATNRLLGDLIRKNNDNLFFA